jgi:hypothetical protein
MEDPVRSGTVGVGVLADVPAGEAVEEGGRSVVEVAGVRAVLGQVAVGPGGGCSDPSMWMASTTVGVDGGR